jgi:HSP20 family protein
MDVYHGEDGSYHVEAGLPGADPDSTEVTVEHGVLTIQAGRTPHYGDSGQVIVAERPQGSFARQLSLGEGVDSENLTAGYAGGVLHVTIPASPKTRARRVEVTRAAGGSRIVPGSTVEPGEAPAGSTGGGAGYVPVPCHRKPCRLFPPRQLATLAAHLATRAQERQDAERGRSGWRRDTAWKDCRPDRGQDCRRRG